VEPADRREGPEIGGKDECERDEGEPARPARFWLLVVVHQMRVRGYSAPSPSRDGKENRLAGCSGLGRLSTQPMVAPPCSVNRAFSVTFEALRGISSMQLPSLLVHDLRPALRGLLRDRGFALTALLTFALCIGANVALFAVVNAVLLHPLPYPSPHQLVAVYNQYPKAGVDRAGASVPHYLERRAGIAAFQETAAFRNDGATLGDSGSPERIESMDVTPSFFKVLGAAASLGRTFTEEEGVYGKNDVVVLSDGLWRQNFGANPSVLGSKVRINGKSQVVIGVMPAGFSFGTSHARLWSPLCFSDDDRKPESRHSNNMSMIARLRPGVSLVEAQSQVDALNKHSLEQDPYAKLVVDAGFRTEVADLHEDFVKEVRPSLLLLQAGVLFLLLIGAVNLSPQGILAQASPRGRQDPDFTASRCGEPDGGARGRAPRARPRLGRNPRARDAGCRGHAPLHCVPFGRPSRSCRPRRFPGHGPSSCGARALAQFHRQPGLGPLGRVSRGHDHALDA